MTNSSVRHKASEKIIQVILKEMEDEKQLIWMDGQKRKIPMTCSLKKCNYQADCILSAFKHYE